MSTLRIDVFAVVVVQNHWSLRFAILIAIAVTIRSIFENLHRSKFPRSDAEICNRLPHIHFLYFSVAVLDDVQAFCRSKDDFAVSIVACYLNRSDIIVIDDIMYPAGTLSSI